MRSIKTVLAIFTIALLLMHSAARAQDEDWYATGRRLLDQQRYDDAIKAFSTAIDIIPRDYQSYNYRGVAWALKNNFERAIDDYSKAIEIRPRYAEAFNNRGFANTQNGNLKAALNDFSRALQINPFFVDAYNNKAWVLATCSNRQIRNGGQAVRLATKAVELKPDISSMDTLAAAHAAAGNFETAVDLQTKAIQQLMLENSTAEVPKYMKHLRSYRSRQALLIDYPVRPGKTVARTTPMASLKTRTKKSPAATNRKAEMATASSMPRPAASKQEGRTPEKANLASTVKSQKNAAAKTHKPAAVSPDDKKVAKAAPPVHLQKAAGTAATPKATNPPPHKKIPDPAVKSLPYTIQVSSFRDPQQSAQVARKLNIKGDPAFTSPVDITGKGKWHRVYIGNYGTLAEAKAAANDLKRRKFRYVNVTRKPYTVQIGQPLPQSKARALQTRLQTKGYFGYRLPTAEDPNRVRILIGAFDDKRAAADLVRRLSADGFDPTIALK